MGERYWLLYDAGAGEYAVFGCVHELSDDEVDVLEGQLRREMHDVYSAFLQVVQDSWAKENEPELCVRCRREWRVLEDVYAEDEKWSQSDGGDPWEFQRELYATACGIVEDIIELRDENATEPGEHAGTRLAPDDLSPTHPLPVGTEIKWSKADSPSRWATQFNCSVDSLKRWIDDGKIRAKKLSTKSWQIAVDDLPATDRNGPTED